MKTNTFLSIICSFLMIFILFNPDISISAATESMNLWSTSVFPSLFPFFVLASILKQTGIMEQLIYKSSKKVDCNLIFTTIIGYICGYPSTSKLIGQSDMDNPLSVYALSTSPSPIFIIGTVATLYLQNTFLALYLLIATYMSLLTTYVIVNHSQQSTSKQIHRVPKVTIQPIGHMLTTAILDGMKSQAVILGIIITVSILSSFLEQIYFFEFITTVLAPIVSIFNIPTNAIPAFCKGLLEMTSGVNAIRNANISLYHKLALCGFATSFGGLSIILESITFINNKIKATLIVVIKLFHGGFTYLYIRLLLLIFPISENVVLGFGNFALSPIAILTFSSAAATIILVLLHRIVHREL